jgi:putative SOS response-associated peptidase YedK
MCYSAMVEQNAKKLALRYKARIQTELYADLFKRRLTGEKLYLNKGFESAFLLGKDSGAGFAPGEIEKQVDHDIRAWHAQQVTELEQAIFTQKKRLADALRSLEVKTTKKAQNDERIAKNKIDKYLSDLDKHRHLSAQSESTSDNRIFPLHYASVLALDGAGNKIVLPVRYLMRPADKDESFDVKFNGCYNARLDSLDRVPWWKQTLGKHHGIMLVRKFYENVATETYLKNFELKNDAVKKKKNLVLCFEPENVEFMFIPVLWDIWKKPGHPTLYSGALITDEPAPEIAAAGHDRTPIFLQEAAIDDWLHCAGPMTEIHQVLARRERPHYSHRVFDAA